MQERQVFWSGGIGDIFALEATFTDEQRYATSRMFWASRARSQLAPLFNRLPPYKNLRGHVSLWDDFPPGFCFVDLEHAASTTPHKDRLVGSVEDWSVIRRLSNPQPYNYSSFLRYRVANIVRFRLPEDYVVVCPYSTVNPKHIQEWRRFQEQDWAWLISHLHDHRLQGVVINTGDDAVPNDDRLTNLSNQTNLGEAIEILKHSHGYFGIDSCFSVLSAQLFRPDQIRVATMNKVYWLWRGLYCNPQTDYSFVMPWLGATEEERTTWIQKSEATPLKTLEMASISATTTGSSTSGT